MRSSVGLAFLAILLISSQAAALTPVSGQISTDTTWNLAGSPYIVIGDVTVASGVTLTIEAGVVVKFEAVDSAWYQSRYRRKLIVDGTLNLQGTPSNQIVFTSSRDDSYGGDSNDDGMATVAAAGNWGYIKLNNGSTMLNNVIFRYGGVGYSSDFNHQETYMVWVNNCSPPVTNCTFEYAFGTALYYYADHSRPSNPQITGNTCVGCSNGVNYIGSLLQVTTSTITGNQISGGGSWGMSVTDVAPATLISGNTITNMGGGIAISNGSPTVTNNNLTGIGSSGGISISNGSPTVSNNTVTGTMGGGDGLSIVNGSPPIRNNTIAGFGGFGLKIDNGSPEVTGNTIRWCGYPIWQANTCLPTYSGNTISEHRNRVIAVSGTLSANTRWPILPGFVHLLVGDVTVNSGATLTIEAGVVVKFQAVDNGAGTYYRRNLIVDGTLNLQGTPSNRVVFTSSRDDSYGGDSNGDVMATVPAAGNWGYIKLNNGSTVLSNVILRYGGLGYNTYDSWYGRYDYHDTYMVWVNNCSPPVINCTFEYAYGTALYYYADQQRNSSPQIMNNTFSNCGGGIVYGGINTWILATPTITGNQIKDCATAMTLANAEAAASISFNDIWSGTVAVSGNPASTVNLENNWWGTFNAGEIENRVTHHPDDPSRPWADFEPFLLEPTAPTDIPGNVAIHPAQSYEVGTRVLSLAARVIDTRYGSVTSGTFAWSLRNSNKVEVADGNLNYSTGSGEWLASQMFGGGLSPGNYTIQYHIITDQKRVALAEGNLTVSGLNATISGTITDAMYGLPRTGVTVHLYDAYQLWQMALDHFNGTIPSLAEIAAHISPVRTATTGQKGTYQWLDIPPGPSYVVYASKAGYLSQYTESFAVKDGDVIVGKDLYLANAVNTLAALIGDTEKIFAACENILDRNAEIMARVVSRSYEDQLWANNEYIKRLEVAAQLVGIVSFGWKSIDTGLVRGTILDWALSGKISPIEMIALQDAVVTDYYLSSILCFGKFGLGLLGKIEKDTAVLNFQERVTNRDFPQTKEGWQQDNAHKFYADVLQEKLARLKTEAGTIPLDTSFSVDAARALIDNYRNAFTFGKDGNLLVIFPAKASESALNLSLGKSEMAYNQASDTFRTLKATDAVLSVVSIGGSLCTFIPGAQGAGIALGAGAAIGKTLVAESQCRALDTMSAAFDLIIAAHRSDNDSATFAFTSIVDLMKEEATSPYYLHKGATFTTSTEVNIGPHVHVHMQIPRPFQDPLVVDEDVVCASPSWLVTGPVFQAADVLVTNTGNDAADIRVLGYVTWTLVPGIATPIGSLGWGSVSFLTGLSAVGPKWVQPGEQASFNIPYVGFSPLFATVPKPHYFCAQAWSGPWAQQQPFTKRFWVLSGFPYDPLFWLSVQGELGTQYASEGDYVYAAVDKSGNLGFSKVAEYMASVSGPDNFVLNSNTPQVETAFVVEGNDVYAVDLKLFAPQDSAVAVLLTDTRGQRLGYSASDGISYSELIGSFTNMAQRPIVIRLLEPPKDAMYTVRIALMSPGPHDVPVSLFYESIKRSGALMTALPSPVIIDGHKGTTQTVFVWLAEISGQEALTGVNAALDTLEMWRGGAALPVVSDVNIVVGDIPAGEQRYLVWDVNYPLGTELGKYVGAATISSNETADLTIPVVALVRHATETVSSYEGPDPNIAKIQKSLTLGPDGSAQTWVHIPRGYHVVHAALGVVAASPNLENPLIDIGADDSIEWDFSGKLDLGLVISNIEDAFNEYLSEHTTEANGVNVPIRVVANAGETVLLNGIQLYLDSIPGDSEPDGDVDWADLDELTSGWLEADCNEPSWCHGCDMNRDGAVDFSDFADFGAAWQETWP